MALVVLTRLPAEGTALFESASIAAWALSARVAACWLPPDQILPRKACESLVAGAAAGALYLAHADATLLATIRLVCLAGALNSAGRAHVAGALLAAAVEAPQIIATAFLAASLALLGAAVRPPRRDASRFEDRVAARPDRAVVLAVRGLCGNQIYGSPPRHRRDTCSMAWRCRFLNTRHTGGGRAAACTSSASSTSIGFSTKALKFCFCTGRFGRGCLRGAAPPRAARVEPRRRLRAPGRSRRRRRGRRRVRELRRRGRARVFIETPPGRGGLGRRIVRRARAALPARAPERGEAAALAYFVRVLRAAPRDGLRQFRAGRGLGPRSYIVARAHGARPRRRPRSLGPRARGAGRRRARPRARARHVVSAALVSWPLTLAPFF